MTFQEIQNAFNLCEDDVSKLEMVMDIGKTLQEIPENADCSEILGCTSFVKICRHENKFYGYADSGMVRGIVAIILAMVDGKTVEEIKKLDLASDFAKLRLNFGASRLNGIQSMINFFKNL